MDKVLIIYGSTTGNTESLAKRISEALGSAEVIEVSAHALGLANGYRNILLGASTWGDGEIQDDWDSQLIQLGKCSWQGKKVALFGTGDQLSYPDTFVDALADLEEALGNTGAEIVGEWSIESYNFNSSRAVKDGKFMGLAIDEDNQAAKTAERIEKWVMGLKEQLW